VLRKKRGDFRVLYRDTQESRDICWNSGSTHLPGGPFNPAGPGGPAEPCVKYSAKINWNALDKSRRGQWSITFGSLVNRSSGKVCMFVEWSHKRTLGPAGPGKPGLPWGPSAPVLHFQQVLPERKFCGIYLSHMKWEHSQLWQQVCIHVRVRVRVHDARVHAECEGYLLVEIHSEEFARLAMYFGCVTSMQQVSHIPGLPGYPLLPRRPDGPGAPRRPSGPCQSKESRRGRIMKTFIELTV
jgi:hypothetical protein